MDKLISVYNKVCLSESISFSMVKWDKTFWPAFCLPLELKSSTKMISLRSCGGDLLITLTAVRNNVVQCSLWNGTITLTVGSFFKCFLVLHLKQIIFVQHVSKIRRSCKIIHWTESNTKMPIYIFIKLIRIIIFCTETEFINFQSIILTLFTQRLQKEVFKRLTIWIYEFKQ